jgi:uncharacterized damage-inducible protein DinB
MSSHSGPSQWHLAASVACIFGLMAVLTRGQTPARTPAESVAGLFASVNRNLLEMAEDFPQDKYNYRVTPEVRSFGEVIVHVLSGNVYAAKAGRGEKVNWDEMNPKDYAGKAEIVKAFKASIDDATATLKSRPPNTFTTSLEPWLGVIEHSAEHYGQLVVYYRANGLVPPASRPKR